MGKQDPRKPVSSHPAQLFEIQAVNLFEQARSAITTAQYDRIKQELRNLVKAAFDAGKAK